MEEHTKDPSPARFFGGSREKIASGVEQPGSSTTDTRPRGGKKPKPRIPKLKKWQAVRISWMDAASFVGAQHSENDFSCPIRHSIGHFIKRSKNEITIAMEDDREVDEASDCDSVTSVPLSMIRGIQVLTAKE